MGKRRGDELVNKISKKLRKLEKKLAKVRRRRRQHSSESSDENSNNRQSDIEQFEGEDHENVVEERRAVVEEVAAPISAPEVEQIGELTVEPTPNDEYIDQEILTLLGREPEKGELFEKPIHKDISIRWTDILVEGLKEDERKELLKNLRWPENLKMAMAPTLNVELKHGVNDSAEKRDAILQNKQQKLGHAIAGLSTALNTMLNKTSPDIIKMVSDVGRLLCDIHFSEGQTRRNFLSSHLDKNVREALKDSKRSELLFGADISEKVKSIKALKRSAEEVRIKTTLNYRGPPRLPIKPRMSTGGPHSRQQHNKKVNKTPKKFQPLQSVNYPQAATRNYNHQRQQRRH